MGRVYNIATAADAKYYVPMYVMLYSLFRNNSAIRVHIYILNNNLSSAQKHDIESLAERYEQEVSWLDITNDVTAGFYTSAHVSVASYYRIFLPSLLPAHIDTVLYMDPDLLVLQDMEELLQTEMGSNPIMAIKEAVPYNIGRLGILSGYDYFNAGVLLLNIEEWRKNSYQQQLLHNIEKNGSHYLMHDQDALNALFYDRVIFLAPKWNHQTGFYHLTPQQLEERYQCNIEELLNNAPIIHFVGQYKPWLYICTHPFKSLFLQYLSETPFKDFAEKPSLSLLINKTGRRIKHKLKKILHR